MARTGACPHPRAQQQIIRLSVSCLHKIGQASAPSQRETVMRERLPMKECSGCSGVCGRGGQVAMLVLQRRVWRRGWRAGSCQVMGGNIHLEVLGGTCAHAPCSNPSGWTPFFSTMDSTMNHNQTIVSVTLINTKSEWSLTFSSSLQPFPQQSYPKSQFSMCP